MIKIKICYKEIYISLSQYISITAYGHNYEKVNLDFFCADTKPSKVFQRRINEQFLKETF